MSKSDDDTKELPVNTGHLLARICKAASERWPEDPSRPGVQVAHLPEQAVFYVALHRYSGQHGDGRVCQYRTTNADLDLALLDIARQVADISTKEQDELAKLLAASLQAVEELGMKFDGKVTYNAHSLLRYRNQ